MSLSAWFRLFRLPNLPTAPGDALAGSAIAAVAGGVSGAGPALAAGGAALLLYAFGLVDNDVVGVAVDRVHAPERPIPSGAISMRAARVARGVCLAGAVAVGWACSLPAVWWGVAALLAGTILLYNRVKGLWLMGICRGLSVFAGTAAVCGGAPTGRVLGAAISLAVGWTVYVAAVTRLSEGEESASEGLGRGRFAGAVAAFLPCAAGAFLPASPLMLLPLLGSVATCAAWCAVVAPLGEPHASSVRKRAVGRVIGALVYLQIGFMLVCPDRAFILAAAVIWFAVRGIRRFAPSISGS